MRRLKTYPALGSVNMPRSAVILDVHARPGAQAPTLLASYDDADDQLQERRFKVLVSGDAIPPGAAFIASWRVSFSEGWQIRALYELGEDIPADLPADAHPSYRLLIRDGFTLRGDRAWHAPDSVPAGHLSRDQLIAVATLQEFGYGPVVNT